MNWDVPKSDNAGARLKITGHVQMVGFRWFAVQWARDLGLTGYVRNMPDGSVLVEVEGKRNRIESLIKECRQGPRGARVEDVRVSWKTFEHNYRDFDIRY